MQSYTFVLTICNKIFININKSVLNVFWSKDCLYVIEIIFNGFPKIGSGVPGFWF
jgi:hypothetical protein